MTAAGFSRVSLDDKYLVDDGKIIINGKQALVRLPILQRQLDCRRGLNTAGFISGYRGSPLGNYDMELWKAKEFLNNNNIVFRPGLNEDLAATAVWGTQQLAFLPGRRVDGVFSIWYGKGPGVDRSGDALKHANMQGTEPKGGILLVFADDHAGKSSSVAHQSDHALAAHGIPVLYPASVPELIEFGIIGFALSRFAGLAVGLKVVNETADATSTMSIDIRKFAFVEPKDIPLPVGGIHIRKELLAVQEQDMRLVRYKLPLALAFARANRFDRIVFGSSRARFVIVTAGKAYADVMGALNLLGIGSAEAARLGLAVYKVAMIYPLEPQSLKEVAEVAEELLFVEEKRPQMETQAKAILFNDQRRPIISGKYDPDGLELLPADLSLDSLTVAYALTKRLIRLAPEIGDVLTQIATRLKQSNSVELGQLARLPCFCAGCPHNTSTTVPEGSFGLTGIGCHSMAMFLEKRNPLPVTHMGGEGANWLGIAPFTDTKHVFQNLGDGTYNHSGSLAIRAAVQNGANITYKILFNDAVAMTGGQYVEGELTVAKIVKQVLAENVQSVTVVSDHPDRFKGNQKIPRGVKVLHRDQLDTLQRELRETPGTTVLIYDQVCAAEKRRRKKRDTSPTVGHRVFINHLVCEGCGDCSTQSNCVAIQPLETDFGRKRKIDQSSCNEDFSCLRGFCPSFLTVEGGQGVNSTITLPDSLFKTLPDIQPPKLEQYNLMITGIGGTGVITIGAILAMAAHIETRGVSVYDMTGLSQKGGAVFSHVRLFRQSVTPLPVRLGPQEADLLIACDEVAMTHKEAIQSVNPEKTAVVINEDLTPTAEFQLKPDLPLNSSWFIGSIENKCGGRTAFRLAATSSAKRLLGDTIGSNMMMVGYCWQLGLIPLSRAALERAIELNGVAVAFNLQAFNLGRLAKADPVAFKSLLEDTEFPAIERPTNDLDEFIARRIRDLTAYQNTAYSRTYADLVQLARHAEVRLGVDGAQFSWAVARAAYQLMAYKDEYEVARLHTDPQFHAALRKEFGDHCRLTFHLSPPLFARRDPQTGRARKMKFGPAILSVFRILARFKWLRGTPVDFFGMTAERKMERRLRADYLELARELTGCLSSTNYADAVQLAEAPLRIRGFGIVKEQSAAIVLREMAERVTLLRHGSERLS